MPTRNIHATAVLLGDRGILITGDSGSGKSTLALGLIRQFGLAGGFARFVADDQVFLDARNGRLLARTPDTIAGLVEVHGLGPRAIGHEGVAAIDLVVRLVAAPEALRFQEDRHVVVEGCSLPVLDLEARNLAACAAAIHAWLGLPPFPRERRRPFPGEG
jgi:serine kinase of HPr protein (carbohydrate metabolism regulator)